jgi:hypothetical protein
MGRRYNEITVALIRGTVKHSQTFLSEVANEFTSVKATDEDWVVHEFLC